MWWAAWWAGTTTECQDMLLSDIVLLCEMCHVTGARLPGQTESVLIQSAVSGDYSSRQSGTRVGSEEATESRDGAREVTVTG